MQKQQKPRSQISRVSIVYNHAEAGAAFVEAGVAFSGAAFFAVVAGAESMQSCGVIIL